MPMQSVVKDIKQINQQNEHYWNDKIRKLNECNVVCREYLALTDQKKQKMGLTQIRKKIKISEKGINYSLVLITLVDIELQDIPDNFELNYLQGFKESLQNRLSSFQQMKGQLNERKVNIKKKRKRDEFKNLKERLHMDLYFFSLFWFIALIWIAFVTYSSIDFFRNYEKCTQIYTKINLQNSNQQSVQPYLQQMEPHQKIQKEECVKIKMKFDFSYKIIIPMTFFLFYLCLVFFKYTASKYKQYREVGQKYYELIHQKARMDKQNKND